MPGFWVFDLGNLSWKAGFFRDGALVHVLRLDPEDVRKGDYDCEHLRRGLRAHVELSDETPVSTPAPDTMMKEKFEEIVGSLMSSRAERTAPRYLDASAELPFKIHYTEGRPGADRIANVFAMRALAPGQVACSVDVGTATNFEIVDDTGDFVGGAIMAGLELQMRALHVKTDKRLPYFELDVKEPLPSIGRTTRDAIRCGLIHGHRGAIKAVLDEFAKELGRRPRVFLTGGDARFVDAKSIGAEHVEHMTLLGLAEFRKTLTQ